MITIDQIDAIVAQSLQSLARELSSGVWKGRREREVVSLFCFGHLLRHCRSASLLYDPAQLAIEVAVPQILGQRGLTGKARNKAQVCKDIVIWPRPCMTCWDNDGKATVCPLSVIEWKHNEKAISTYDVSWLCAFSSERPEFIGYAVCTRHPAQKFTLSCTRVFLGQQTDRWLHIS